MEKKIEVKSKVIREREIVNSIYGRARLDYIGRQSFTNWTLLDEKSNLFPFGKQVTIEDNYLDTFII